MMRKKHKSKLMETTQELTARKNAIPTITTWDTMQTWKNCTIHHGGQIALYQKSKKVKELNFRTLDKKTISPRFMVSN